MWWMGRFRSVPPVRAWSSPTLCFSERSFRITSWSTWQTSHWQTSWSSWGHPWRWVHQTTLHLLNRINKHLCWHFNVLLVTGLVWGDKGLWGSTNCATVLLTHNDYNNIQWFHSVYCDNVSKRIYCFTGSIIAGNVSKMAWDKKTALPSSCHGIKHNTKLSIIYTISCCWGQQKGEVWFDL